ncbi:MAG: bifunctional (p)ppGpp synthetase/guanosine-3',5'-bis(diphosphate) 3'-pyrophosphohydrolase, partial [Oscillospiraceae bacterium]|nr:bifunctional (p)ppGpp synthetase/guanosine-3',5'-bis(diphosphate) 3'-pyrophosphohydrolase [Oscillospiraceae bacterium]
MTNQVAVYDDLLQAIRESDKTYDLDKIGEAYRLADEAHGGQKRKSGDPYISHPVAVAIILVGLGMDTDCICAALMHDVVEDTDTTLDEIRRKFGGDVAVMVNGVTKLGQIPLSTKEEQQAENVRKMLLAMNEDVRVIIIKLADRLHNMRTAMYWPPEKQRSKSLETMEIYAPIAHRLGIRSIKDELEDLALRYLDPVGYHEIENQLEMKKADRENFVESVKARIADRLHEYGIEPHISGRVKSVYGIYRKVYMAGKHFEEIYDIYAVRVIVDTIIECYNILGIIHDLFTPIPNRFKDYISTPKPNMYQSLHTTVIDKEGIPFEIQIRTWDMHYTAEYGIAAHWKYKAGISGKDRLEDRLAWVRQIIESQQEAEGAEDIVKNIKTDLSADDVFVFTPKGDVKSLPAGSTIIDFAYAIHTAVGNRMTGAKVDGRIVPLEYQVKTGEIVEILTTKNPSAGPSRDWLKIAKTSEARNKIRSWFKRERREENIAEGKAEVEREFRRSYIHFDNDEEYQSFMEALVKRQHKENLEDFYAAIGYGGILLSRLMPRIKDDYVKLMRQKEPVTAPDALKITVPTRKNSSAIIVEGIDNCQYKLAQCCNPLPGDDIVGFITRGYGVSVHKRDCPNAISSMNDVIQRERWIGVRWADKSPVDFRSTLEIIAHDRTMLLADVSVALSNMRVPIHEVNARELKNGNAAITVTVSTQGKEH